MHRQCFLITLSGRTHTHTQMRTHMDVELHILPLAETSKFVTVGWEERENGDLVICLQTVQLSAPTLQPLCLTSR